MLVLTVRVGESVIIGPEMQFPCKITVLRGFNDELKLGFAADRNLNIVREKLLRTGDRHVAVPPVD